MSSSSSLIHLPKLIASSNRLALASAFCLIAWLAPIVALASDTNYDGIILQQHGHVSGNYKIFVCPAGTKIESNQGSHTIFCLAPKWRVEVYNHRSRARAYSDLKHFDGYLNRTATFFGEPLLVGLPLVKLRQDTQFSLPVTVYSTPESFTAKQTSLYRQKRVAGAYPLKAEFHVLNEAPNPKAADLLCQLFGVPAGLGIPLSISYVAIESLGKHTPLITLSVSHFHGKKQDLTPPGNYRTSSSVLAVLGGSNRAGTENLLDLIKGNEPKDDEARLKESP